MSFPPVKARQANRAKRDAIRIASLSSKWNTDALAPSLVRMETGANYKKNLDRVYLLKNVHAAIASNMMAMTHKDESLIPVFLAMRTILS